VSVNTVVSDLDKKRMMRTTVHWIHSTRSFLCVAHFSWARLKFHDGSL